MTSTGHALAPNVLAALEMALSTHSSLLGRAVHAQIIRAADSPIIPPFLSNHLINMYSKLNLLNSAQLVLSLSPTHTRSVVTWTALISGFVRNGHFDSAILHFSNMRRESIQPNDYTLPCAFKASHRLPETGKQIHCLAVKLGLINDVYVGCSAFDMYSKIGLREDACKVFDEMPEKNLTTWNAYISNSVLNGQPQKAIGAFIEYRCSGGAPDSITFCAFLNACSDALYLELGRQLHGYVARNGYEQNVCVANGLIDFYGKCGEINSSELVFDGIHNRNDVSWCSIVAAYEQNDEGEKACMTFIHARREMVEMKDFIVSSVLSACAAIGRLELGRSVHAVAVKACIDRDVFVGSALVDMYGKCGSLEDCESAFDEMPERNVITWNALIGGYAHQGYADMALALYEDMTRAVLGQEPSG